MTEAHGAPAPPHQSIQVHAPSLLVTASMATVHCPDLQGNRISGKTETFNNSPCQYRSGRNGRICTNVLNKPTSRMSDPPQVTSSVFRVPHGEPHVSSLMSKQVHTLTPVRQLFPACRHLPSASPYISWWLVQRG